MSQTYYPFNPQMGTEDIVMKQNPTTGAVYFTTDTRKIYLDIDKDRAKIPMGGNVGLFYGKMKPAIVVDGQKEFKFEMRDIEGNEDNLNFLIPNVDDLILNSDGCFYKVVELQGEGAETVLVTEKLTIAGSGGGGGNGSSSGGGTGSLASFSASKFNVENKSILKGASCPVKFIVKSTNDVGEYETGDIGTYKLFINNYPAAEGPIKGIPSGETSDDLTSFADEYINVIDIAPYLPTGTTIPVLQLYDKNGVQQISRYLPSITVSSVELTWDYDNSTLNEWIKDTKESMTLEWNVSGDNLEKITYITIDSEGYPREIGHGKGNKFTYNLNFKELNLLHGAHTIKMWVEVLVGGVAIPTEPIYKNIIVAQDDDPTTIISVCLFEKELKQYNTVAIPIYIYSRNNISGNAVVKLIENGSLKDEWTKVPNLGADPDKVIWSYTPVAATEAMLLTVQSGGQEKTITVTVSSIGVTIEEKSGYAFKFKANEFASNTNVKNWKIGNSIGVSFSDKFDWINGGLKSETDPEAGHRQFFAVKAGSTMTIKYPLWRQNAPATGKHFKFIFKTTNCRDYDAQVLSCKADRKILHIDKTVEYFLLKEAVTELTYSKTARLSNGVIELSDTKTGTLDVNNKASQDEFVNSYVYFGDQLYQCAFIQVDPEKDPDNVYNAWYKVTVKDSFQGLLLNAQNGGVKTLNESLEVQYCEDTYIELEVEVTKSSSGKKYIKFWIDGVPCGYTEYSSTTDRFVLEDEEIIIGSPDCDVQVYLAKLYETELDVNEHMSNFYMDAPNAEEMIRRYQRNDIMDKERPTEISLFRLAEKNPNCLVHHYEVNKMPTTKKTEIYPCGYKQYQGSKDAKYYADGVMIKVQGTSSEKYVVAAANLDTDFNYTANGNVPTGIINGTTHEVQPDGWSMDGGTAIPIKYACTKVNVASCENVNNMANQEWYNIFQPYKSVLRCKNPRARDTMQFTPGVIFVTDKSTETSDATGVSNNVFADTIIDKKSYAELPIEDRYPKMYSLGQMGNSKENLDVLHDRENTKECCVEVSDNQMPQQWMVQEVSDEDKAGEIGESKKFFEFRYPKKAKNASREMIDAWNDFVHWMAHSNPQPKYKKFENITTQEQYDDISINKKTFKPFQMWIMDADQRGHSKINGFDENISTYYIETDSIYGYTEELLDAPVSFEEKEFEGFIAKDQKNNNGEFWQKDYKPMIQGCVVNQYVGTYTHDTYEYRMAKMLSECEEHLVMDSVLYHYLFIERHCMIDNVAKNTFWSTEDCKHWNLIKNYDNDTADGNDNQGKFTRTYGMEPTDPLNENGMVFNAHQSVWFNFCHGLDQALSWMYEKLENAYVTVNGKSVNVWDHEAYLNYCKNIQSSIPERCWIEDYQRKYFRPNEVYNDNMYNSMLEGGQKKFQRKQYETYQNLYMGSKYRGSNLMKDRLVFRPTGVDLLGVKIPTEVYSDCYIYSEVGGQIAKTRAKRNQTAYLTCPVNNLGNATMYIHPGSNFTKLGSTAAGEQLCNFSPDQMSFAGAKKLREIVYGTESSNSQNPSLKTGIGFSGNTLLETAYLCNLDGYEDSLDMSDCTSLIKLNCKKSGFTDITIANGAPTTEIKLEAPSSLTLRNLTELDTLDISNTTGLRTLILENIDNRHKNFSKTLVSAALNAIDTTDKTDYLTYKITDVKWTIDDSSEITNQHNITLFDRLLSKDYAYPSFGADESTRLPYSAAFTGTVDIDEDAYSGNTPLEIYNKYITNDKFANVDINFEADSAKLYNVIIYDGDGVPFWQKKTVSGTMLNDNFLNDGPNGKFDIDALEKSPTAEYLYELLPQWTIKTDDENYSETISNITPTGITITSNIYIYPQFKTTRRKYDITIKMKHPYTGVESILAPTKKYEYGSKLSEIVPADLIPYANSSNLTLYQAYDFKGYGLVEGSSLTVTDTYTVSGNATLWAIFKLEEDIRTITHLEYFDFQPGFYLAPNEETIYGLQITPKVKNLKGKITIPSYVVYENEELPVVSIKGFGATDAAKVTQEVTHIFMEQRKDNKKNQLYSIEQTAFCYMTSLKYFDFENCAVEYIGSYAFRYLNQLEYIGTLGKNLKSIGQRAFNQSFTAQEGATIRIPSSVTTIGTHGFSQLTIPAGCTLEIGSSTELSKLVLDESSSDEFSMADSRKYTKVIFYSLNYDEGNKIVEDKLTRATDGTVATVKII